MSGTRDRLLDAAWQVARDDGLRNATSRRITEVAGANLQAITYHFGSKDALVGAALVRELESWLGPLRSALGQPDAEVDAALAAVIAAQLQRLTASPDDVLGVVRAVITCEDLPGVRQALGSWTATFRAAVVRFMQPHQAAGTIPAATDLEAMAGVFTALAFGIAVQAVSDAAAPSPARVAAAFLALLHRDP